MHKLLWKKITVFTAKPVIGDIVFTAKYSECDTVFAANYSDGNTVFTANYSTVLLALNSCPKAQDLS